MEDGAIKAVYSLCSGDMRRVVNMLQVKLFLTKSLSMRKFENTISSNDVYNFTGNPTPEEIKNLLNIMLNEKVDVAFDKISIYLKEMGVSLDIVLK